ncbi:hypothetical protein FRB90_000744 [Tulasnella sp. 427]|nr:hypothetical protein FRB90_000744 [Tulasnella sp. 427]
MADIFLELDEQEITHPLRYSCASSIWSITRTASWPIPSGPISTWSDDSRTRSAINPRPTVAEKESYYLAALESIRNTRQAATGVTVTSSASPPVADESTEATRQTPSAPPTSQEALPTPPAAQPETRDNLSSHHAPSAPAKQRTKIPRSTSAKKAPYRYLNQVVDMPKEVYNFFLRVVRSACGKIPIHQTWRDIALRPESYRRPSIQVLEAKELAEYLRGRFENDWIVEIVIVCHLQERKRGQRRASDDLNPAESQTTLEPSPPSPDAALVLPLVADPPTEPLLSIPPNTLATIEDEPRPSPPSDVPPSTPSTQDIPPPASTPTSASSNMEAYFLPTMATESVLHEKSSAPSAPDTMSANPKPQPTASNKGQKASERHLRYVVDENSINGTPLPAPPPPKKPRKKSATPKLPTRPKSAGTAAKAK